MANQNEFDLTRNDKFYKLSIPNYTHYKDCVFYEIHLKDLVKNETYIHELRYKQLKQYHQKLEELKLELPEFPKTHFWKKTNKNPTMIKERQVQLQSYFSHIVNDPFIRGYKVVKTFIKQCKFMKRSNRCLSIKKVKRQYSATKSKSLSSADLEVNFKLKKL